MTVCDTLYNMIVAVDYNIFWHGLVLHLVTVNI